ncbi:hypothetical protein FOZ62_028489 [Perkinsus olseni]|uniref:Uncharacterized protein n=1 Tax=Perkinsus olseni TaxID=32597 RepID=A0A7J6QD40_PEROL|nr:hypothetical protein FOZ62_028489 [Perkinsus olseni]
MPRILRVEGGITVEYLANVAKDGNCFDRIWEWKSSEDGGEYVDASGQIDNELAELCHTGFVALEPSPDVSTLDGIYTGDGPGKNLYFDFNNGTLKDAYLSVREISEKTRMAMYYPVCDGILSLVSPEPGLKSEETPAYLILKRSRERARQRKNLISLRKRRGEEDEAQPLVGDEGSNYLCKPEHVRRKLRRSQMAQWDRNLPEKFILKRKA